MILPNLGISNLGHFSYHEKTYIPYHASSTYEYTVFKLWFPSASWRRCWLLYCSVMLHDLVLTPLQPVLMGTAPCKAPPENEWRSIANCILGQFWMKKMAQSDYDSSPKSFESDTTGDRLLPGHGDDFIHTKPKRRTLWNRTILCLAAASVLVMVVILTTISNATFLWHRTCQSGPSIPQASILHCGGSPEKARALGCVFDVLDYSWTPKPCFNRTLFQLYRDDLVSSGLTFWNNSEMTQVLPNEEVFAAKHEYVFSTRLLHKKHCEYYLHRQSHVIIDGLATSLMRNSTYSLHCLDEVLRPHDPRERLFTGFHYEKCALGLGYLEPARRRPPPGSLRHWVANGALNPPWFASRAIGTSSGHFHYSAGCKVWGFEEGFKKKPGWMVS